MLSSTKTPLRLVRRFRLRLCEASLWTGDQPISIIVSASLSAPIKRQIAVQSQSGSGLDRLFSLLWFSMRVSEDAVECRGQQFYPHFEPHRSSPASLRDCRLLPLASYLWIAIATLN